MAAGPGRRPDQCRQTGSPLDFAALMIERTLLVVDLEDADSEAARIWEHTTPLERLAAVEAIRRLGRRSGWELTTRSVIELRCSAA